MINKPIKLTIRLTYTQAEALLRQLQEELDKEYRKEMEKRYSLK